MSKCTRSLSLILTLILSFSLFSVNAFAVDDSENLVDGNLSNWVDCGESLDTFQTVDITSSNNNNIISVQSNSKGMAIIYDLTEFLKIGESYQLSFTLPVTNNTGLNYYSLGWTLANSVDGPVAAESRELVYVKNSNKSDFLGKTITFEFTYTEGYKNTCLALYIWGNDGLTEFPSTNFYINDVSLTRVVTESEKKLDGILGWLQDIWDKLVSIGDGLTEVWTNITSSVSALGDRISSFFSDLGNKITTEFTNLTSDFSGYISSLGDRISGYFENLSVNISGFFTDLLDGIKEFFRGFGNLILYFNWEGEYTNPFESSDSIIGGGSEDSEDEDTSNNDLILIDLNNYSGISSYFGVTDLGDNVYRISKGQYGYYGSIAYTEPLPKDKYIKISFTVSDLVNDGAYPWVFKVYRNVTVSGEINSNGDYSFIFPSNEYDFENLQQYDEFYFQFEIENRNYSYTYFKVSNFGITLLDSPNDTGSSDDTSSDVSVQGALDNILEYLSTVTTDIENVMDSITGSIKLFSDFCDEFPFIKALCIFVLALIIYSTVIGL